MDIIGVQVATAFPEALNFFARRRVAMDHSRTSKSYKVGVLGARPMPRCGNEALIFPCFIAAIQDGLSELPSFLLLG